MTDRGPASATAEVTIDVDPEKVYGLITDLRTLASLAEENEAMEWRKGDSYSNNEVIGSVIECIKCVAIQPVEGAKRSSSAA